MADELHDLRTKVPTRTLNVLHALSIASGDSMADIARRWLTERAGLEAHNAKVLARVLKGEGSSGEEVTHT